MIALSRGGGGGGDGGGERERTEVDKSREDFDRALLTNRQLSHENENLKVWVGAEAAEVCSRF